MIQVAIDGNGYVYETDTGYLVNVAYDELGNAIDAETGESLQFVRIDPPSQSGGSPVYTEVSDDVKDVLIAIFGNANQIPPSNRIPVNQIPAGTTVPLIATPRNMIGVGAGVSANQGGIGGNLNISTMTLILIAGGFLLFTLGKNKR